MELDVPDPMPALNAPADSHLLQQGFWGGAQAGEKQVAGAKGLAVTCAAGHHFHDPAGADPGLSDVLWSLFGAQHPGDVAAVGNLVILCHERDLALSLELRSDLAMQCLLVGLGRQVSGSVVTPGP